MTTKLDLIKTIKWNIQHLKSCLGMCEAHMWNGTRPIKTKYQKRIVVLNKKLREEQTYLKIYVQELVNDYKQLEEWKLV